MMVVVVMVMVVIHLARSLAARFLLRALLYICHSHSLAMQHKKEAAASFLALMRASIYTTDRNKSRLI
jgi:hypothetical protein